MVHYRAIASLLKSGDRRGIRTTPRFSTHNKQIIFTYATTELNSERRHYVLVVLETEYEVYKFCIKKTSIRELKCIWTL